MGYTRIHYVCRGISSYVRLTAKGRYLRMFFIASAAKLRREIRILNSGIESGNCDKMQAIPYGSCVAPLNKLGKFTQCAEASSFRYQHKFFILLLRESFEDKVI